MSDFIIEIADPTTNLLEIETTYIDVVNNIEIERSDSFNIEIVNTEKVLVGDLPDNIPLSKLKLIGPDSVSSYLDSYQFDCGTP